MSELILENNNVGIIAKAELDTQISTAKAYPRKHPQVILDQAIELATMDEATAQSCFYCLPRTEKDGSKKEIRGASIRLAEIVANAWGNLHVATRIISNDGKSITTEGVAWDLQSNVKISMQNKISIWHGEKNGKGGYPAKAEMQVVLSNASSAKALRNAIFKVVPKALVDRVLEKAMSFAVGDQKTVKSKAGMVIDKLVKMGIDQQKILDYYGRSSAGDITAEDLQSLIGVGTAIKEGHIKIEEVFEQERIDDGLSAAEKINNLLHFKKSINLETGEVEDGS